MTRCMRIAAPIALNDESLMNEMQKICGRSVRLICRYRAAVRQLKKDKKGSKKTKDKKGRKKTKD